MPLWSIYHTPGIFTEEEKHGLAARITDHYHEVGLPRFYVVVAYHELTSDNLFVGGEPTPVGVRVVIDHIARRLPDEASRRRVAGWVNEILRPYLGRHDELHWEFHVDETSADLWMINGLVPPGAGTDAEKGWRDGNLATPY